ncbi:unnamed protein product, partial [Amoebophrya sp. A120]
ESGTRVALQRWVFDWTEYLKWISQYVWWHWYHDWFRLDWVIFPTEPYKWIIEQAP